MDVKLFYESTKNTCDFNLSGTIFPVKSNTFRKDVKRLFPLSIDDFRGRTFVSVNVYVIVTVDLF